MTIVQVFSILIALSFPVILFLIRFLAPDIAFDSINYHLFLGARFWDMLTQNPILTKEFFPTGLHNYPGLIDLPSYLFYSLFGYRLSTLTSLFSVVSVVLLAGFSVNWKRSIPKQLLMGLALINLVFVNEALFQVGTNMVEGLSALVLFAGVVLFSKADFSNWRSVMIAGLTIGLAIGIKFTNLYVLIFSLPFFTGLILLDGESGREEKSWKSSKNWLQKITKEKIWMAMLFLICTLIPFGIWGVTQYLQTGNPVFPYFNNLFRSEYYPEIAYSMPQYGPENLAQALVWPAYSALVPERLGEIGGWFADYRLIGYFGVIVPLLFLQGRIRRDHLVVIGAGVLGTLSWSIFSGYIRFVVGIEFVLGYAILLLVASASVRTFSKMTQQQWVKLGALALFLVALGCHLFLGRRLMIRNSLFDYAWRPTVRVNPEFHERQWPFLFDRKLELAFDFEESQDVEISNLLTTPDVFLNCGLPSTSLYVLSEYRDQSVPVVVLNRGAYGGLLDKCEYTSEVMNRVGFDLAEVRRGDSAQELTFVTLFMDHFHNLNGQDCKLQLERLGASIDSTRSGTILGSDTAKVIEWHGTLPVKQYLGPACGE